MDFLPDNGRQSLQAKRNSQYLHSSIFEKSKYQYSFNFSDFSISSTVFDFRFPYFKSLSNSQGVMSPLGKILNLPKKQVFTEYDFINRSLLIEKLGFFIKTF